MIWIFLGIMFSYSLAYSGQDAHGSERMLTKNEMAISEQSAMRRRRTTPEPMPQNMARQQKYDDCGRHMRRLQTIDWWLRVCCGGAEDPHNYYGPL